MLISATPGPDVAGLLKALANLPSATPAQKKQYRRAAATHKAARQMREGRRYRTRDLPRRTSPLPRYRSQPRDSKGRWCR